MLLLSLKKQVLHNFLLLENCAKYSVKKHVLCKNCHHTNIVCILLWVIFAHLDLDPDPETQINADPDPQPCPYINLSVSRYQYEHLAVALS